MALNDPQWGKRGGGNDGPPDLDEMWRSFNQKLNRILNRRRGGGGGGGSEPPSLRNFGGSIWLLLGLIIVIWLASGLYIVVAGQRGVVLTFGKYTGTTDAGLRWHLPWPIQSVDVVNVTGVRTIEIGYRNNMKSNKVLRESLMLTDDENIVDIQFAVQYVLKDPVAYLFNNRRPDEAVKQVAESATREVVGKSKMDFVLYEGREQVAAEAQTLMQKILDRYKTGVEISKVTMQNAQPPEQVQAAFDDAVRARQDLDRQKNEGQAYYNDVVPKARGTAARLLEEAAGYKQAVIDNAQGDASRFDQILVEYKRAPGVMRERLYLDALQQILSSTTKILVDTRAGSNLLYLPLDKLVQMTGASKPEASGANGASATGSLAEPVAQGSDSPRSRDSLRSRAREDRP